MANNSMMIGVGIVVVIVVVGAFLLMGHGSGTGAQTPAQSTTPQSGQSSQPTTVSSSGPTSSTPVVMSDPPYAPAGTSEEAIAYSDVMVHTTNGGWVAANGSGTINLNSTTAASAYVMAYANTTANSNIDMVRYHIDNAFVTVNGTDHPVAIANSNVTADVSGSGSASSGSAVLIQNTPTIVALYSNGTVTYAMQTSARAVVASSSGISSAVGSQVALSSQASAQLSASAPQISITAASISTANNQTSVTVTVKNNGGNATTINNVLVYGNQSASAAAGSSVGLITPVGGLSVNILASINSSNMLALSTSSSSGLALTSSPSQMSSSGVTVNSNSAATMTFTGHVQYDSNNVNDRLKKGSQYMIVVTGSAGAAASTTTTAS